jgi:DNA-binding transcriptional MerR regulator
MDNRNYSQITFEFSDVPASPGNEASLGVRVKSLKADQEPAQTIAEEPAIAEEPIQEPTIVETENTVTAPAKKSTRGRKSLKALDAEADLVNIPDDETLFQRQYYSIGEVADMFGVNQSLLRFWENEFDIIQPRKNRKGDRHFRPIDIKNLELIYDLLRRRKLTIEGAKDFLKKSSKASAHFEMIQSLQSLKGFLLEIKVAL